MALHEVDSWGRMQSYLLRDFLDAAQRGDAVVFDQRLVDTNGGERWLAHILRQASGGADLNAAGIAVRIERLDPYEPLPPG